MCQRIDGGSSKRTPTEKTTFDMGNKTNHRTLLESAWRILLWRKLSQTCICIGMRFLPTFDGHVWPLVQSSQPCETLPHSLHMAEKDNLNRWDKRPRVQQLRQHITTSQPEFLSREQMVWKEQFRGLQLNRSFKLYFRMVTTKV